MAQYSPQRGTYDAFFEDSLNIEYIEDFLRDYVRRYGFTPIHTPIYESTSLFSRSAGESSDIVTKEMFNFTDKSGREITLRPEFTAGVMRAIVTNKLYATRDLPLKLNYLGPIFRYERPQLGRYRQFNQFGIEIVGGTSYLNDVEAIVLGYNALKELGFKNLILKINSIGDEESRNNYKQELKAFFAPKLECMCADCKQRFINNPLRILDCKVPEDIEIIKGAPRMGDYLNESSKELFKNVLKKLDELGVIYEIDNNLVRGLDYYSHVVFEYHYKTDNGTDVGAIGAGGQYDNLVEDVGGPKLSSVGFAFGIERLNIILKEISPETYKKETLDLFIITLGANSKDYGFNLMQDLRSKGYHVDMSLEDKSFRANFKIAERKNAKYALIVGEDEIAKGQINIKDLNTQVQNTIEAKDLDIYLKELLKGE